MIHATHFKWVTVVVVATLLFGGWSRPTSGLVESNTWYIAPTGSDASGDGSQASPFATIQHGIDSASDGDTVLVFPALTRKTSIFQEKTSWLARPGLSAGNRKRSSRLLSTVIAMATPLLLLAVRMQPPPLVALPSRVDTPKKWILLARMAAESSV